MYLLLFKNQAAVSHWWYLVARASLRWCPRSSRKTVISDAEVVGDDGEGDA
jgi:hypothetical protein